VGLLPCQNQHGVKTLTVGNGLMASLMADFFEKVIGRIDIEAQLVTKKKQFLKKFRELFRKIVREIFQNGCQKEGQECNKSP
jgi:hypothetical protein